MHSRGQTWQATRDRISREIASGHLPADTRLPSEPELCLLYDTRRHSLRRALRRWWPRGSCASSMGAAPLSSGRRCSTTSSGRARASARTSWRRGWSSGACPLRSDLSGRPVGGQGADRRGGSGPDLALRPYAGAGAVSGPRPAISQSRQVQGRHPGTGAGHSRRAHPRAGGGGRRPDGDFARHCPILHPAWRAAGQP